MVLLRKGFKHSSLAYTPNCHIIYQSLVKNSNDFHEIVFKMDFKHKLTCKTIFAIFLLSGWLTAHKAITKICKIGLASKFTFEILTILRNEHEFLTSGS